MWKDIIGWEGLYQVNENGDVINKITKHVLVGDVNPASYSRVCLYCKQHKPPKQRFFRHRLVALHFIDNPNNLPEVNHKDCNTYNNNVKNLEWVSKKENELHSRMVGKKEYKPFVVIFQDEENITYNAKSELSHILGVSVCTIRYWLEGKNKGFLHYGIKEIHYI